MAEAGRTVTVEAVGDPRQIADEMLATLLEALTHHGGAVSGATDGSRYGATFSLHEPGLDVDQAATRGLEVFRGAARGASLPDLPIVDLEVLTFAEDDADLERSSTRAQLIARIEDLEDALSTLGHSYGFDPDELRWEPVDLESRDGRLT